MPATVSTLPGVRTFKPPCPTPERYAVPRTSLPASRSTTAPRRRPGYAGVKVTDTWQVPLTESAAEAHGVVTVPLPRVNSRLLAPRVSTLTVLTVPAALEVTVTVCVGGVAVPT